MPVLPLPQSGTRINGGDLVVSDSKDVLSQYENAHRAPVVAPVRDALNAAFAEIHKEYERSSGFDLAQVDPLRATGDFLTEIALEYSIAPNKGELAGSIRSRIFGAPNIVTPQSIVNAVNAILASYTTILCQLIEPELDGMFLSDGVSATTWDGSFINALGSIDDPHYPDRFYIDDTVENGGFALSNNMPGGSILSKGYPRNFHLRLPELAASDLVFAFLIDATNLDGSTSEGFFLFNGSQDDLSDVGSNNFAFNSTKTSDDVYSQIVGVVESIKGQGISWSAYVDPYLVNPVFVPAPTALSPVLSALSVAQTDSLGGDQFLIATVPTASTVTGVQFSRDGGATWVPGTVGTLTSTTVQIIPPTMAASTSGLVRVSNIAGPSNTLAIEFWAPTDDASVKLLFDAQSSPYNSATGANGIWTPRYTAVAGTALTMFPGSAGSFASDGAGGVVEAGAGTGGTPISLSTASVTLSQFLSAPVASQQAGSYATVFSSQTTLAMNAAGTYAVTPYQAPGVINNAAQGTTGIETFVATEDSTHRVGTHIYGAGGYTGINLPVPAGLGLHAVVSRWHNNVPGATLRFGLSVDGSLTLGSGYIEATNDAYGTDGTYTATPIQSGVTYAGGSQTNQLFKGTIKSLAILNARATDTFITKFNKWKLSRFGT